MAIAQASGSQTDDVAACWAVIAAAYGWQLLAPAPQRGNLVLSAIALGLAAATKQTALLFGAAALLPVLLGLTRQRSWRWLTGSVVAGAAAALLLAGPQWYRTWSVFGNLSGDPFWTAMASATARGPAQVVSGVVRNLALHFGTPWVAVNQWVAGAASTVSSAVGADPNDPRTTWWSGFGPTGFNTHEDTARNPLHLLLLLVCTLGLTRGAGRRHRLGFVLALAAAFVVFSTVLKWQPYHSRLQTPLFALGLAWAAVELERISRGGSRVVLLLLSLAALPQALLNYTRPLIALPGHPLTPRPRIGSLPRALQYFMIWPHLANPFIDVSLKIAESGCNDVGVRDFGDAWDYPVMALVREAGSPAKFRSVDVTNLSARLAPPAAPPCLLLQIGSDAGSPPRWAAGWRVLADWRPLLGMGGVVLFGPAP
jgi:4-amino-4-deoxy-L-arabinose transferase-like glycosyltransferase